MIERPRRWKYSGPGNPGLCRDEAGHAAERRRAADGGRRLGSRRPRAHSGCHGRRRPAAGSSGRMFSIPGVPCRTRIERGELCGDGLAQNDGPGVLQPANGFGVLVGNIALIDRRTHPCCQSSGFEDVLDADRDAVKRSPKPSHSPVRVALRGGVQCVVGIKGGPCVNPRLDLPNAFQAGRYRFDGGCLVRSDSVCKFRQ